MPFQAGLVAFESHFKLEEKDDGPETLGMEHFYFPLGLWLAGLLLSVIFLLAEIIMHRRRKSQTEVGMLRLVEPSVAQSTPESENLAEMVLNNWKGVRLSDTEGAEMDLDVSENIEDTKV